MSHYNVPVKKSDVDKPHVLVIGSPTHGFRIIGPYPTWAAACRAAEDYEPDVWLARLKAPRRD